jgi:hypothetical protein
MHSVMDEPAGCDRDPEWRADWCIVPEEVDCRPLNGCPNPIAVYAYFYSFTMVVSFVMINLFVGVIMTAMESLGEDAPDPIIKEKYKIAFYKRWAMDQFDPDCKGWITLAKLEMFIQNLGKPMRQQKVRFDLKETLLAMEIRVRHSQIDHDDLGATELHIADVLEGVEKHVLLWRKERVDKKLVDPELTNGDKMKEATDLMKLVTGRQNKFLEGLDRLKEPSTDPYQKYRDRLKNEDEDESAYVTRMKNLPVKVQHPDTAWVIPQFLLVEGGSGALLEVEGPAL